VSPITERDFQSDEPLHPSAAALLNEFFEKGWPDPSKIHHQSAQLRNLLNTARESIAQNLAVHPDELEFVGELGFGFQTAIGGLLKSGATTFCYSKVDRQVVHAFAREHQSRNGVIQELTVDHDGLVDYQSTDGAGVLSWQSTNRETGVRQKLPAISDQQSVFVDLTAGSNLRPPVTWDSALWDPRSFRGPQGIAIVGISRTSRWRNPGPQIDNRRVYGSYSKPLLLATAVALEHWCNESEQRQNALHALNQLARELLLRELPEVKIAGQIQNCDPRYLAFCLPGVVAEELLRKVEGLGFLIDAGSACGSGVLEPSHVLTAMGMPMHGNIRITFKPEQTLDCVKDLIKGIAASA
jgi:cysteine desulfurase